MRDDAAPDLNSRYPLGAGPGQGECIHIGEHVRWYRIVSSGAPMGGVNIWALRDGDGWAIVDTGFADPDTAAQWQVILDDLALPVTRIICTHFHPDHIGQVGMLQERFDAPLFMTDIEWQLAKRIDAAGADRGPFTELLHRCGMGAEALAAMAGGRPGRFSSGLPDRCEILTPGETIAIGALRWRIETGAGHSPRPAILVSDEARLALVGDQLLMRITPHVGVDAEDPEGDPLGLYLDYLNAAVAMPQDLLALAGHGPVFRQPGLRATEIADHHDKALRSVSQTLGTASLACDVLMPLFGRIPSGVGLVLALTEALAHLNRLVAEGRAQRFLDAEGRYRFGPA
ncbi:MBL fold metallo-hydrolase [Devosia ginsengisoli]|uniref:MBL fold metallo-hydrolase n=1 Tax=Devosia ginsengisoli TaxID=400770 RepID=UPI0026F2070F|nr:MBL fold metallo-hydrolase [Devosia ginsengisoli]MCR6672439.1 MBL fold metallo-hydrolase [Devosia ginsengisoli]